MEHVEHISHSVHIRTQSTSLRDDSSAHDSRHAHEPPGRGWGPKPPGRTKMECPSYRVVVLTQGQNFRLLLKGYKILVKCKHSTRKACVIYEAYGILA